MAKQCEKQALASDSTPTPAGQAGQPDGGQQDTGSHQEQGSNREHQGDGEGVTGNVR
jgi:hypothetical protein